MERMSLYEAARSVPQEARKEIGAGRLKGMTDVNPMFRIKRLTEMFGPCGIGWWYDVTDKQIVYDELTKQKAAFVDILLYYVDPESGEISHGIPGTGGASFVSQESKGAYLSDECYKMSLTDAISVAAKAIGVAADVYFEKDCTKYSPKPEKETLVCEQCGQPLKPYVSAKSGKTISPVAHAKASRLQFGGKVVCYDCIVKNRENADVSG